MNYCPECGQKLDQAHKYCAGCGHQLTVTPAPTPPAAVSQVQPPVIPGSVSSGTGGRPQVRAKTKAVPNALIGIGIFLFLLLLIGLIAQRMWPTGRKPVALSTNSVNPHVSELLSRYESLVDETAEQSRSLIPANDLHSQGVALFLSSNKTDKLIGMQQLEKAVELEPWNNTFRVDLADAYAECGDKRLLIFAIDHYDEILWDLPDNDYVLGRLSEAYARNDDWEMAFEYAMKRAGTDAPNRYGAGMQITMHALLSGKKDKGLECLRAILRDAPNDNLVQLLLAILLADTGAKDKAAELIQSVKAATNCSPALSAEAGRILERLKK